MWLSLLAASVICIIVESFAITFSCLLLVESDNFCSFECLLTYDEIPDIVV